MTKNYRLFSGLTKKVEESLNPLNEIEQTWRRFDERDPPHSSDKDRFLQYPRNRQLYLDDFLAFACFIKVHGYVVGGNYIPAHTIDFPVDKTIDALLKAGAVAGKEIVLAVAKEIIELQPQYLPLSKSQLDFAKAKGRKDYLAALLDNEIRKEKRPGIETKIKHKEEFLRKLYSTGANFRQFAAELEKENAAKRKECPPELWYLFNTAQHEAPAIILKYDKTFRAENKKPPRGTPNL